MLQICESEWINGFIHLQVIVDFQAECKTLKRIIGESDVVIQRQRRELDKLISERNILGSQLVRRNDELSLLYEKIKILQSLFDNGNRKYNDRVEVCTRLANFEVYSVKI